jgi:hypothetical protein
MSMPVYVFSWSLTGLMCCALLTNVLFQQDDQEGVRTVDDDNFIDDTGVDPADRYGIDDERHSPSHYAQVLILNLLICPT